MAGATVSLDSVVQYFESLPDPRHTRNRRHLLVDVMVIAVCGVIVGCEGPTAIARWAQAKKEWLVQLLELPNGIHADGSHRTIAIGGKTMRRSHDGPGGLGPLHLVSAWASELRRVRETHHYVRGAPRRANMVRFTHPTPLDRIPAGKVGLAIALFQLHRVDPQLLRRATRAGADPDEAEVVPGREGQRVSLPLVRDGDTFLFSRPGHEERASCVPPGLAGSTSGQPTACTVHPARIASSRCSQAARWQRQLRGPWDSPNSRRASRSCRDRSSPTVCRATRRRRQSSRRCGQTLRCPSRRFPPRSCRSTRRSSPPPVCGRAASSGGSD